MRNFDGLQHGHNQNTRFEPIAEAFLMSGPAVSLMVTKLPAGGQHAIVADLVQRFFIQT
jgi:hypothetical protein